jgi:hypothetical protein
LRPWQWKETADFSTPIPFGRNEGMKMEREMVDFAKVSKMMGSMEGIWIYVS